MRYAHILNYVARQAWAILPEKMEQVLGVLAFRAAGGHYTDEQITARVGAELPTADPSRRGAVAVIPLRGMIAHRMNAVDESSGGMSVERFGKMYRAALADPSVGAIVLDVDSPGGTVEGIREMASELLQSRGQKRVVAVANSLMASAAYWLAAAAADEIVAIPSARVGSIGVFAVHTDLSAALEKEGIDVTIISAGKYKTEGNQFEPLTDEAKAQIQARIDEAYGAFVSQVAKGRGTNVSKVRGGYGEGRALMAKDALDAGLIDGIATLDQTLAKLTGKTSSGSLRAEHDATAIGATDPDFEALY